MNKNRIIGMVLFALVGCAGLYYVEQVAKWSYFMTTPLKLCIFVVLPYIYIRFFANRTAPMLYKMKFRVGADLIYGGVLGLISAGIILIAFSVLSRWIDMNAISHELINKSGITPLNFVFIGLYITLINSFVEEFFFRGFLFLGLYGLGYKKLAYGFSALLFSVYHISIFATWFGPALMGLALIALFMVGLVFAHINVKSRTLYNSWLMHGIADAAIISIGLKMFDIL